MLSSIPATEVTFGRCGRPGALIGDFYSALTEQNAGTVIS